MRLKTKNLISNLKTLSKSFFVTPWKWEGYHLKIEMRWENEDILVTHSIVHFPNGSTDAVMMVHMKKDGLLWRTETGSTPMPKE